MVEYRSHKLLTQKMHDIIRRDTIFITHIAVAIVALIDIFKDTQDEWPLEFRIISLVALAVLTAVGALRARTKSILNHKPLVTIVIYSVLANLITLTIADYGAPYIYFMLMPVFLASVYYSEKVILMLYSVTASAAIAAPFIQEFIYRDGEQATLRNILLNCMAFITAASLSRLFVDANKIAAEDKQAIRSAEQLVTTEKSRIEQIISSMNDAVIGVDTEFNVTFVNPAVNLLFNTHAKLVGKPLQALGKLYDDAMEPILLSTELAKLTAPKTLRANVKYTDEDSAKIDITLKLIEPKRGGNSGFVIICSDITKAVALEEERHAYISLLSHEIRTPMAIIEALLSNADFLFEKQNYDALQKTTTQAHEQVIALEKIVNELAQFISVDAEGAAILLEDVALDELLNELRNTYQPVADKKGIALIFDIVNPPKTLHTNKIYLSKILSTLLDNAIKYTDSGTVTLRTKPDAQGYGFVVADTGIGIRPADIPHIFKANSQQENHENRNYNGLGLGLYIASRLAKAIGSEISVQSTIAKGSAFSFICASVEVPE